MTIEQLNADFGLGDQLKFVEQETGFPMIQVENALASALISIYAGQVLSFKPAGAAQDVLFLTEKVIYKQGKAIRGGAPVCWPWFGPDPEGAGRPNHGFVRNRLWTVKATEAKADGTTFVALGLEDTPETQEIWPHAFGLTIAYTIGATLTIELTTQNRDQEPFSITQALHTYFTVADVAQTQVLGLANCPYLDKVAGGVQKTQDGAVTIAEEVDRVYSSVPNELVIVDAAGDRQIHIHSTNSTTAVVWNPWIEKSKGFADLDDSEYLRFLCVETANVGDEVITIPAGGEARLTARYSLAAN